MKKKKEYEKKKRRSNKKTARNDNRNSKIRSEDTGRCRSANKEGTEILKGMRVEIQSKIEEEARNIKISEDNIAELKNLIDQNKTELKN